MGVRKKSDTITRAEACWDFLEDEEIVHVLQNARKRVANQYPDHEVDDAYQEAVLYMAARPALVKDYVDAGELGNMAFRFYTKMVQAVQRSMKPQERIDGGW